MKKAKTQKYNLLRKKNLLKRKSKKVREVDGPVGPEPTRYGDWERKGRCVDF
ncbi:MAG: succinate dehydrogenase assembly factor 4 [Pseudomonadota bacterium]|nr:succinate dehydrogenase assembly factor 4 [Pseudomonadota bacterium]MEC8877181.1 succinate dehydrogenase assembly factor 4 [Pseudomonadota bacterium]|tara:strand:+ start:1109 stop:1264 length:156 start_codon:yes stop_codon:yes gene_type:complete